MKLFTNKKKLQAEIKNIKNISFVPTMGALHKGHESLIKRSIKGSKITIVSIFVNPKQFNDKKDFSAYPKNLKKDIRLLKRLKVNYLYRPNFNDIYNFKTKNKIFLHNFSKKLCGKYRKGHFRGVLNVVNRLLEIIQPKKIYLGNKDFQQLYLIKEHIKKNKINTIIVPCKTIRNNKFIAYSSRTSKLKQYEIINLANIIKFLKNYKKRIVLKKINHNIKEIRNKILLLGAKKVDYVELLNLKTMKKPKRNKFSLFFAFNIGNIRFIDNF